MSLQGSCLLSKGSRCSGCTQHVASSKLLISLDFLVADLLMRKGRIRLCERRAAWTTAMVGTEPGAKASWMYFPVHCVTHTHPHTHSIPQLGYNILTQGDIAQVTR